MLAHGRIANHGRVAHFKLDPARQSGAHNRVLEGEGEAGRKVEGDDVAVGLVARLRKQLLRCGLQGEHVKVAGCCVLPMFSPGRTWVAAYQHRVLKRRVHDDGKAAADAETLKGPFPRDLCRLCVSAWLGAGRNPPPARLAICRRALV